MGAVHRPARRVERPLQQKVADGGRDHDHGAIDAMCAACVLSIYIYIFMCIHWGRPLLWISTGLERRLCRSGCRVLSLSSPRRDYPYNIPPPYRPVMEISSQQESCCGDRNGQHLSVHRCVAAGVKASQRPQRARASRCGIGRLAPRSCSKQQFRQPSFFFSPEKTPKSPRSWTVSQSWWRERLDGLTLSTTYPTPAFKDRGFVQHPLRHAVRRVVGHRRN